MSGMANERAAHSMIDIACLGQHCCQENLGLVSICRIRGGISRPRRIVELVDIGMRNDGRALASKLSREVCVQRYTFGSVGACFRNCEQTA